MNIQPEIDDKHQITQGLFAVAPSLRREHGQIGKSLFAIPGRSARAFHGAGRFPLLTVFPAF